jgi:predicted membrane protein (TIGR00267 family)
MSLLDRAGFLLRITHTQGIIRRYFVVNGFDGALTMLGLMLGFLVGEPAKLSVTISACMGAAIALGVSGVSSAYVSEVAERRRALLHLEEAMVTDLQDSEHGEAARWVPVLIALVNGSAPLVISLFIMLPLWLAHIGIPLQMSPLHLAVLFALLTVFLLGVFLGKVSGISWFRSGVRTLLLALVTAVLIYLFAG